MHQSQIIEVFDSLENFILLKQQNVVIYFWMLLKKNHRMSQPLNASKFKSQSYSIKSSKMVHRPQNMPHILSNPYINRNQNQTAQKMNYNLKKFPTEYHENLQQNYLYQTSNKQRNLNKLAFTDQQTYKFVPERRQYPPAQPEEMQLDDSDQFQDIVLDRLTKLQQNINKLMRQKKMIKEHSPPHLSRYENGTVLDGRDFIIQHNEGEGEISNRKRKFFDSLQNGNDSKLDRNEMIYNLKYIPVGNKANNIINKQRQMLRDCLDEQDMIEDIEFFNENQLRQSPAIRKEKLPEKHSRFIHPQEIENSNPSDQTDQDIIDSKQKGTSTLYMNRYAAQTTRHNRVHYIPNNIEMQTVVELRKKYNRSNAGQGMKFGGHECSRSNIVSFQGVQQGSKASHESLNNSYLDYHSSRKNNHTTYY